MLNQLTTILAYVGPLLLITLKVGVVIGGTGTALEAIGGFFKLPRLVAFGQLLEHIGANVPGIVEKVKAVLGRFAPVAGLLIAFTLSVGAGLACSGRSVAWPRVLSCAAPLEQPLLIEVGKVLAGTGDVQQDLEALAGTYAPGLIECAVQQIVSDLGKQPVAASGGDRRLARGRAFLAKVEQ
jgi:hypothetical protein